MTKFEKDCERMERVINTLQIMADRLTKNGLIPFQKHDEKLSLPKHICRDFCSKTKCRSNNYANGKHKYCAVCEGYFTTEALFCSCCGTTLRRKAR